MGVFELISERFDTSTWTEKEWMALHAPILFGVFANIFCVYLFRLLHKKHRASIRLRKHLQIRHKHLFIAHLLIAWYWVAIHPLIVFVMVIFDVPFAIGYCIGYFMVFYCFCNVTFFILSLKYNCKYAKQKTLIV